MMQQQLLIIVLLAVVVISVVLGESQLQIEEKYYEEEREDDNYYSVDDTTKLVSPYVRAAANNNKCRTSVNVQCTILDSKLPCNGHLKIKPRDCQSQKGRVPIRVKIDWQYCNNDQYVHTINPQQTYAKYKKWTHPQTPPSQLKSGDCITLSSIKNINVCKVGAVMSMKYTASMKLPNNSNAETTCYAYKFLRVRKEWLTDEEECSVTTGIDCTIAATDDNMNNKAISTKIGQSCVGNIARRSLGEKCSSVTVELRYQYCFWNLEGQMNFSGSGNDRQNNVKINNKKISFAIDTNMLLPQTCRTYKHNYALNTCWSQPAYTSMEIGGFIGNKGAGCSSYSELEIPLYEPCDYQFIITEILLSTTQYKVELYTPQCPGQVIAEPLHLLLYKNEHASYPPISLKGLEIKQDGFVVVCSLGTVGRKKCDVIVSQYTKDLLSSIHSIAIVNGNPSTANSNNQYTIQDVYGTIDSSSSTKDIVILRKPGKLQPQSISQANDWILAEESDGIRVWQAESPATSQPSPNPTSAPGISNFEITYLDTLEVNTTKHDDEDKLTL